MQILTEPYIFQRKLRSILFASSALKARLEIGRTELVRNGFSIVAWSCIRVPGSDPHLDNRVHPMHAPFATKHERLAAECSRPEAQTDCLPGQKWRCEKDGHRWRRHKCRYAAPPPPQKVSKKCACFTPNGVIYTRLESNDYDGQKYAFARDRRPVDPYDDTAGYFTKRGKCLWCFYNLSVIQFTSYFT